MNHALHVLAVWAGLLPPPVCYSAPALLRCFHPTASYSACREITYNEAKIYYQGGFTRIPYQMIVSRAVRGGFERFAPLADNAIIGPNPQCDRWEPFR